MSIPRTVVLLTYFLPTAPVLIVVIIFFISVAKGSSLGSDVITAACWKE